MTAAVDHVCGACSVVCDADGVDVGLGGDLCFSRVDGAENCDGLRHYLSHDGCNRLRIVGNDRRVRLQNLDVRVERRDCLDGDVGNSLITRDSLVGDICGCLDCGDGFCIVNGRGDN